MLNGKTAIVTGGTRGIGKEIALQLVKQGADIAVLATQRTEMADTLIKQIAEMGCKAGFFACNVADEKQVTDTITEVIKSFGKIDILINNAGITRDQLLIQMKEEEFKQVIDVNLTGCFHMLKACIRPFIKQRYGRIVNISSVVGMMGNAGQANYAASKAGIIGLTKSVAKEYATKGITCNAIAPGYIQTEMTQVLSEQASQTILNQIPQRRLGKPEDVANLVSFLVQEEASYITGEVIRVDGGMYI